jgi:PST family polysaccharide transporter
VEAAAAGGLSLASAVVVARWAGPAEFGVAAAVVAVHVLLWIAATALFADALVQRPALQPGDAASAAVAASAIGVVGAGIQVGAGWWLAARFSEPRLLAMGWVLAVPLPLVGAAGAAQGLLTRARGYRQLAMRTLVGQGFGTAVGFFVAARGGGAWALVGQQAIASGLGAAVLLGCAPAGLWGAPRWRPVREMLRFGLPLTAATLLQAARYRVFAVLVGTLAGPAALGQLHMAFRLVDTVRDLANNALWRLLLPRFSVVQHDTAALQAVLDRALAGYCAVLLPLLGVMLLVLRPLVLAVLGPAWLPAAAAALPLVLLAAQNLLGFAGNAVLIARGRPGATLATQAATLGLTVVFCVLWPPLAPLEGALIWAAATLIAWPPLLWLVGRAMGTGPWRQFSAGMPALLATAVATAAGAGLPWLGGLDEQAGVLLALVRVAVFFAVGAPLAGWLWPPRGLRWAQAVGLPAARPAP